MRQKRRVLPNSANNLCVLVLACDDESFGGFQSGQIEQLDVPVLVNVEHFAVARQYQLAMVQEVYLWVVIVSMKKANAMQLIVPEQPHDSSGTKRPFCSGSTLLRGHA